MKYKIKVLFFMIALISLAISSPFVDRGFADQQEVEIKTVPENELFSLKNLAPGQSKVKNIIIQNSGKNDFHYQTWVKYRSGSKQLFDMLDLTISAATGELLFNGKLKDFSSLEDRTIAKDKYETLTVKIGLPQEAGNEFQGLVSVVDFQFLADGEHDNSGTNSNTDTKSTPSNGTFSPASNLPNTATNMYNVLAAGTVLIVIGFLLRVYLLKRVKLEKH